MIQERLVAYKSRLIDIKKGEYIRVEGEFSPNYVKLNDGRQISRVNIIGINVLKNQSSFVLDDGSSQIEVRSFENDIPDLPVGTLINVIGKVREFNGSLYIIPEIVKQVKNKLWVDVREIELNKFKGDNNYPHLKNKLTEKPIIADVTYNKIKETNGNSDKYNVSSNFKTEKYKSNSESDIIQKSKKINNNEFEIKEEVISEEVVEFDNDTDDENQNSNNLLEDNNDDNIFDLIHSLITTLDNGDGVSIEEIRKQVNREETDKIIKRLMEEGEIFEIKPGRIKIL